MYQNSLRDTFRFIRTCFAVLVYVFLYQILYEQNYRKIATDTAGSTKLLLKAPKDPYIVYPENTSYCIGGSTVAIGGHRECHYLDEHNLLYPLVENSASKARAPCTAVV